MGASERQPPARHQIEDFRLAGKFHHHRAKRGARQAIAGGAQNIRDIGETQNQELRRIEAKFQKPRRGEFAEFEGGEILPDPQHGFFRGEAKRQRRREGAGRGFMTGLREDFMQRAALQPAFQTGIGILKPERNALLRIRRAGEGGAKRRDI